MEEQNVSPIGSLSPLRQHKQSPRAVDHFGTSCRDLRANDDNLLWKCIETTSNLEKSSTDDMRVFRLIFDLVGYRVAPKVAPTGGRCREVTLREKNFTGANDFIATVLLKLDACSWP